MHLAVHYAWFVVVALAQARAKVAHADQLACTLLTPVGVWGARAILTGVYDARAVAHATHHLAARFVTDLPHVRHSRVFVGHHLACLTGLAYAHARALPPVYVVGQMPAELTQVPLYLFVTRRTPATTAFLAAAFVIARLVPYAWLLRRACGDWGTRRKTLFRR